ncbi:MAG: DUF4433 domain-containing protein [Chloroflexota bacterium]|nr:DUF4433 domain-containing protein [Chloroflexota bacterium]
MNSALYHITNINNLPSIINYKALFSYNKLNFFKIIYTNIAYEQIQSKRGNTKVPCYPCGNLHDYVPFHFAPRSPMLFTLNKGNVPGYDQGQKNLVYLIITIQEILSFYRHRFVFTNGHPINSSFACKFFNDIDKLCEVDWETMESRYWTGDNRKFKRQAEFLVYEYVSLSHIRYIGVYDSQKKSEVELLLKYSDYNSIPVVVDNELYF